MAFALTESDVRRLQRIMSDLLAASESDQCMLCDEGGNVLAQEGVDQRDPFLISALGAGVFGASRELARVLGEDEFSAVLHQGDKKSIFLRAVDSDILLVVIFSKTASLGLVKLYVTPAVKELQAVFDGFRARGNSAPTPEDCRPFVINTDATLFKSKR